MLRIQLLGGFRVALGDRVVPAEAWRLRKARSLVKLLALAPEHVLHREQLVELLWPDREPETAGNNLRYAMHVARRAVEAAVGAPFQLLQLQGERLALAPAAPVWVDVEAFESAATDARRTAEPAAYEAALELYTGDLLPEDRYEDWAAGRREALRATSLALMVDLAQLHEARSAYPQAIEALEHVVGIDPAHEQAHVSLMRLYVLSGRRSHSLQQYQRLQQALRQELDTEPDLASKRLYAEIQAHRFPPAAPWTVSGTAPVPAVPRHNLPVPMTSLIGRARELATVRQLLETTRLLTLTGAGGCGKTRLALAVAADVTAAYPDGVRLVELAALAPSTGRDTLQVAQPPALVASAVAAALGIREEPGRPLIETLVDALRAKRLLVVIDNCEHLVEAVARLAVTLLASSPGLQVLATSREALRTEGELTWRVPSLALPDLQPPVSIEELRSVEAVGLFLDRVHLRQPDFILTSGNAAAVIEICRRLDGLPLAIELAAARVPLLGVEQLALRLNNALHVLTGGSRTAVPRHQTLRATLDWSYALLDAREQDMLNRLTVFANGWTVEAAESIAPGNPPAGSEQAIEERDVLELLSSLVDKSLVQVDSSGSDTRYRLLETTRQHALQRLQLSGQEGRVRQQHARYYLSLAERAANELIGPQQIAWCAWLETDHDNLRTALGWCAEHHEAETGARLAAALARFWYLHSHLSEGRRWLEAAREDSSALPLELRERVVAGAALLAERQGDWQATRELCKQRLALAQQSGDTRSIAWALNSLAIAHSELGDETRAVALLEESLALCRAIGDRPGIARAVSNLGELARINGDFALAAQLYSEGLNLFEETSDALGIAQVLSDLSSLALLQGDAPRAMQLIRKSLAAHREVGNTEGIVICLEGIAGIAAGAGHLDRAARLFGAVQALRERLGAPGDKGDVVVSQRYADIARAGMGAKAFAAAQAAGRTLSLEAAVAMALDDQPGAELAFPADVLSPAALSLREREVARLVAQGLTNRQIAEDLAIAERTVDTHVSHVLHKLGLASRAQTQEWAAAWRLLEQP